MVGADRVVNAVGLNSVLIHSARILGPAGAGVLIATVGVAPCFLINAPTFGGDDRRAARRWTRRGSTPAAARRRRAGGVRAALRYVRAEPALLIPLAMMAVVGTLGFNFQVLLPLLARFTFDGGAGAYTALAVAMAVGSIGGALATGARGRVGERLMVGAALALRRSARCSPPRRRRCRSRSPPSSRSAPPASPSPPGSTRPCSSGASPAMRGRVMALYSVVFLGSTPIGGPIVGWLAEVAGPRAGLVLGGVAALAAAARRLDRVRSQPRRARLGASSAVRALAARGRRWRRLRRGARSRYRPGVRISRSGSKRRRGLDVEAHPVALLDRGDGAPRGRARRARSAIA